MAEPDAIDRYLGTRFSTANPTTVVGPQNADLPSGSYYLGTLQPGPTGGSSSASGGTAGGSGSASATLDWHAYLTDWGFPPDVVTELDRIFRTYSDPTAAGASALAYIRGTDWYSKTFPGIQEGMRLGVVSNEQDYRSYTNQLNDIYSRYYGRSVTGDEVANALKGGHNANWLNSRFAGQAYITANRNDIQYDLGAFDAKGRASDEELNALGDQQAGLDNLLGPQLQQRLALAKQKLATVFQGTLASPSMSILNGGEVAAPSLAGGRNNSDVSA